MCLFIQRMTRFQVLVKYLPTYVPSLEPTVWSVCGNLPSALPSILSQLSSSSSSLRSGFAQPQLSSSKAQSISLEEATCGEAVLE